MISAADSTSRHRRRPSDVARIRRERRRRAVDLLRSRGAARLVRTTRRDESRPADGDLRRRSRSRADRPADVGRRAMRSVAHSDPWRLLIAAANHFDRPARARRVAARSLRRSRARRVRHFARLHRYLSQIHSTHLLRTRDRGRVSGRGVEYRCGRAVGNRCDGGWRDRSTSRALAAFRRDPDSRRGGRSRRRLMGRTRRMAASASRRQRSYQHDHAQFRSHSITQLGRSRSFDGTVGSFSAKVWR